MHYLENYREKRRQPKLLLAHNPPLATRHSLIVLAVNYHQFDLPPAILNDPSRGIIASYAWGDDYHEIIRPLLYQLDEFIHARPDAVNPPSAWSIPALCSKRLGNAVGNWLHSQKLLHHSCPRWQLAAVGDDGCARGIAV